MMDHIQYGTSKIDFSMEFAERKTLGIKVYPDKSVHVIAPVESTLEEIKGKIKSKASWILKQQEYFLSFHPLTPERQFISGETHLYLGKQYRLRVKESKTTEVKLQAGFLEVYVPNKSNKEKIEQLLKDWYKEKARYHFEMLYEQNLKLTNSFKKQPSALKYRWMDKRWGSCDKRGGIHLNLELIKAPKKCIEYVLVHELCHLEHHDHSRAFYELLEKVYPDWRRTKERLEKMMV